MLYAVICSDKPDGHELRAANRAAHVEYLQSLGDALKAGGPFTDEAGEKMNGSLLLLEAGSITDLEATLARDPYAQAGLFATVDIRPWKWTVKAPEV